MDLSCKWTSKTAGALDLTTARESDSVQGNDEANKLVSTYEMTSECGALNLTILQKPGSVQEEEEGPHDVITVQESNSVQDEQETNKLVSAYQPTSVYAGAHDVTTFHEFGSVQEEVEANKLVSEYQMTSAYGARDVTTLQESGSVRNEQETKKFDSIYQMTSANGHSKHVVLHDVKNYLEKGNYPRNGMTKNEKANFRKQCKSYKMENGKLLHKKSGGKNTAEDARFVEVIMDRTKQIEMLKLVHEGTEDSLQSKSLAAHRGRDATIQILSDRCYWQTQSTDAREWIRTCLKCQACNKELLKVVPPLKPIPPPNKKLKQIGIDLITLPEVEGFRYAVIAIDYFTKTCKGKPLKDKSALSVADFIFNEWICEYGCPEIQINDQGKEFVNEVSRELQRLTGVHQRVTSAYHPQANGLVERQNQTIKNGLLKVLEHRVEDWPRAMPGIIFAHKVQRHGSTKYSPFFLLYGQDPVLPIDVSLESQGAGECSVECPTGETDWNNYNIEEIKIFVDKMLAVRAEVESKARKNIFEAQKKQKKDYDNRHTSKIAIQSGDLVFLKNVRQMGRKGGWKESVKKGPYEVLKIDETNNCTLLNPDTGTTLKTKANITNLRLCEKRDKQRFPDEGKNPVKEENNEDNKEVKNNANSGKEERKEKDKKLKNNNTNDSKEIKKKKRQENEEKLPTENSYGKVKNEKECGNHAENSYGKVKNEKEYDNHAENRGTYERKEKGKKTCGKKIDKKDINMNQTDCHLKKSGKEEVNVNQKYETNLEIEKIDKPVVEVVVIEKPMFYFPVGPQWQKSIAKTLQLEVRVPLKKVSSKPVALTKQVETKPIRGDGNCWFRSISMVVTGSEEYHKEVRNKLCTYMINEKRKALEAFAADPTYFKNWKMQKDEQWATDVEIMATASMLNTDIYVLTHFIELNKITWQYFGSDRLPQYQEAMPKKCHHKDASSVKRSIYIHNPGNHFQVITGLRR